MADIVWRVSINPVEVLSRITFSVDAPLWLESSAIGPAPFVGATRGQTFKVWKRLRGVNSFQSILHAVVDQAADGAEIRARWRMPQLTRAFCVLIGLWGVVWAIGGVALITRGDVPAALANLAGAAILSTIGFVALRSEGWKREHREELLQWLARLLSDEAQNDASHTAKLGL